MAAGGLEERFFRDTPAQGGRREETPLMTAAEAGRTVVAARNLQQVAFLVVVIDTAEEAGDGIFILPAGHFREHVAGSIRAHQVQVVQGFR